MRYLLDTNSCIYLIKRRPPQVLERFRACRPGEIGLSAVTVAELHYGVAKSQQRERNREALEGFLLPLEILPFDAAAAAAYGSLRTTLERQGIPIGPLDMMITAHALSLDLTLVSNNTREFERVPSLRLENWV